MDLNIIWFIIIGILFTGYAMLDGFDLGVGILHLFEKDDTDRRIFLNAIGPVWDGNEVWLVTGGGALFAAFPEVYATVFSGFYDAFMLLLFALIFRAVAIEFRSKSPSNKWRRGWDIGFSMGSFWAAFLIGVTIGNIAWGIPLDSHFDFQGNILTLLHPYALFAGVLTVALFAMHGNIYLILKTEGELQKRLQRWIKITIPIFVILYLIFSVISPFACPQIQERLYQYPILLGVLFVLNLLVVFNIPRQIYKGNELMAFLFSCLSMGLLMILFAISVFPNMVFSYPNVNNTLTIYNGASTHLTLSYMFIIAIIGVPIVLTYTACVYYIFRGKVTLNEDSY